ncbi:MAG: hypothetical protein FWD01_03960 [Defluviitaleaceae bacterium]|nr:hypothetical protein [Defluviitaleaceae bacterium]
MNCKHYKHNNQGGKCDNSKNPGCNTQEKSQESICGQSHFSFNNAKARQGCNRHSQYTESPLKKS